MILQTKRLQLRSFQQTDQEDLYEIYSDPKTCKYLLHDPWPKEENEDECEDRTSLNRLYRGANGTWHIACVLDDKVIGDIMVWYTDMKETVEIGYVFHRSYTGKGYAKEALQEVIRYLFYEVGIHRIQTNMDVRNIASAKLCENLGMRKEAHFIKDFWNKGEWTDSYAFGMLREDFEKME